MNCSISSSLLPWFRFTWMNWTPGFKQNQMH
jgi:hypothetical protein